MFKVFLAGLLCTVALPTFVSGFSTCGANTNGFVSCSTNVDGFGWTNYGPATWVSPTSQDPTQITSSSAIQNVAHNGQGVWFAATVNGGVWRTTDINAKPKVQWVPVTDNNQGQIQCSSIGAVHVDRSNPKRVYFGCGGPTSSEMGPSWNTLNAGYWGGLYASDDLGDSWYQIEAFPTGQWITHIESLPAVNGTMQGLLVATRGDFFYSPSWDRERLSFSASAPPSLTGGIWRGTETAPRLFSFTQTLTQPCFDIEVYEQPTPSTRVFVYASTVETTTNVVVSADMGVTWQSYSPTGGFPWSSGYAPFYTTLTITAGDPTASVPPKLVLLGLTVGAKNASATFSDLFVSPLPTSSVLHVVDGESFGADPSQWTRLVNMPMDLDQDAMPKDRSAVLADPGRYNNGAKKEGRIISDRLIHACLF